ncbi:FUSC family protein [Intrasporangium sp.]|uniref:FUSC family protein n=1 Tax=Intrasporangium sp. TaxID=1925024 RepID=UPI0032215000
MRVTATFRANRRSPLLQVLKSAVATVAAWLLAGWLLPGPLPVFAAIAALLVVQPSLNQSFAKAVERTVGVIVGSTCSGSTTPSPRPSRPHDRRAPLEATRGMQEVRRNWRPGPGRCGQGGSTRRPRVGQGVRVGRCAGGMGG